MQYSLTGIDSHLDFGFGVTGEAYYSTAKFLNDNGKDVPVMQLKEMPVNFLYRHSIELFLKSLIIIFHKKLKIKYDQEPYSSNHPKIFSNGKWVNLYRCHWIDELYRYWKDSLLIPNQAKLTELSKRGGEWKEEDLITKALPIITKYDRESSFFRYPVTENEQQDLEKFTMQPIDAKTLFELLTKKDEEEASGERKSNVIMALKNDNGEIVKAYAERENLLADVTKALQEVSHYFYCMHIMSRVELCDGN